MSIYVNTFFKVLIQAWKILFDKFDNTLILNDVRGIF